MITDLLLLLQIGENNIMPKFIDYYYYFRSSALVI